MNELRSMFSTSFGSRILIEANAGTGKTYTIQGLYLRFLLEKKLDVSEILVVTFTKLATKELRSRILQRLQDARQVILHGYSGNDAFLNELAEKHSVYPNALERITKAIREFDESSIYTIHGYCQKILTDFSFYTQTTSQFTVQQHLELHLFITENYWREYLDRYNQTDLGKFYLSLIVNDCDGPETLLTRIRPYLEKYAFSTLQSDKIHDNEVAGVQRLYDLKCSAVALFRKEAAQIIDIFHRNTPARFAKSRLRDLLPLFEHMFEMGSRNAREKLRYFSELKGEHPFFDVVSELQPEIENHHSIVTSFYIRAAREIRERYHQWAMETEQYHVQDLLQLTSDAIHSGIHKEQLLQKLRKKWPVALVDEFQDTDPLQYSIFNSIYDPEIHKGILCLIGDPKQAIYSFRGADIYTYLQAKSSVPDKDRFSLIRNYRSHSGVIDGVNRLIGKDSFSITGLHYQASLSGKEVPEVSLSGTRQSPVMISIADEVSGLSKEKAEHIVLNEVVLQLQSLLHHIKSGDAWLGNRLLKPSDIVVLLQKNQTVRSLQSRLIKAGIGSVSLTKESIYTSREAQMILALIRFFLDPFSDDDGLLKATGMLNDERAELKVGDDLHWESSAVDGSGHDYTEEYMHIWNREGFYPAFYSFMSHHNSWQRVMSMSEGERTLSNLHQLAVEIQEAQTQGKWGSAHMLHWLKRRIIYADSQREDEENDLETDDDRIRLMTLHKSKGLQFPIVFCPDLWKSSSVTDRGGFVAYHSESHHTLLDLSSKSSDQRKRAISAYAEEKRLEQIRTAYVGITRAESQIRLFWVNTKDSVNSGLYGLLPLAKVDEIVEERQGNTEAVESPIEYFDSLTSEPDIFGIHRVGQDRDDHGKTSDVQLDEDAGTGTAVNYHFKTYTGPIDLKKWNSVTDSFSSFQQRLGSERGISLSSRAHLSNIQLPSDLDEIVRQRVDDEATIDLWTSDVDVTGSTPFMKDEELDDRVNLPKGASFGSFFHACLEDGEFHFNAFDTKNAAHMNWLGNRIEKSGYDQHILAPMGNALQEVCLFQLEDFSLRDLKPSEELREMEFYIPFQKDRIHTLLSVIRKEKTQEGYDVPDHISDGFLTGFIDLIVIRDGKVWIIDYKTNYLGDHPEDYAEERLERIIRESFYDLQYTLYTLALKRYLETWLPGYHHARDFKGVAYLFIRALNHGSKNGVWVDRPDDKSIAEIENLIYTQKGGVE